MKAAVLHPPFGPGKAASGEHGVVHRPRTVEASHLHIQRFRPDFGKRDDGDAKLQPQLVADPAGRCLEGVLKRLEDLGCSAVGVFDGDGGAVPAEHEGMVSAAQCIHDGGDHRRPGHVDGLVAARRNRLAGIDDVAQAKHPIGGQAFVNLRLHHPAEVGKGRQGGEIEV